MSDAAVQGPARQSASQLSENIGDVLASIRRLIAQDEDADDGALPHSPMSPLVPHASGDAASPAASLQGGTRGGLSLRRARAEAAVAQRMEIIAEAKAMNRRSEVAFATVAAARVGADGPGRSAASAPVAGGNAAEMPLIPSEAPAGAARGGASVRPGSATLHSTPLRLSSPLPANPAAAARDEAAGARPVAAAPQAAPAMPQPAQPAAFPASVSHALRPLPKAEAPTPRQPETEMTLACTTTAAPLSNTALAGNDPASQSGRDDGAGSILSVMIREVVRSELQEPGMTRDLRAMILREIAQVLTKDDRGH